MEKAGALAAASNAHSKTRRLGLKHISPQGNKDLAIYHGLGFSGGPLSSCEPLLFDLHHTAFLRHQMLEVLWRHFFTVLFTVVYYVCHL